MLQNYGSEINTEICTLPEAYGAADVSGSTNSANVEDQGSGDKGGSSKPSKTGDAQPGGKGCPPGIDCDWVAKVARDGLNAAGYASGGLGGIQIGMLEFRQSLSVKF